MFYLWERITAQSVKLSHGTPTFHNTVLHLSPSYSKLLIQFIAFAPARHPMIAQVLPTHVDNLGTTPDSGMLGQTSRPPVLAVSSNQQMQHFCFLCFVLSLCISNNYVYQ